MNDFDEFLYHSPMPVVWETVASWFRGNHAIIGRLRRTYTDAELKSAALETIARNPTKPAGFFLSTLFKYRPLDSPLPGSLKHVWRSERRYLEQARKQRRQQLKLF
jgi:hypothetical protein